MEELAPVIVVPVIFGVFGWIIRMYLAHRRFNKVTEIQADLHTRLLDKFGTSQELLEHLSDFLMDGGFAGGPHYHPYWGWSGDDDVNSTDALKNALLQALLESGQLTPEMIDELRGEGQGDEEVQQAIADLLDELIQKMVEEGYINLETGNPQMPGATYDVTGQGKIEVKPGPLSRLGIDIDKTVMFLYNVICHSQTQTGSRPFAFSCKKRIKDL